MTSTWICRWWCLYNEEESLPHLVDQLLAALRPSGERFELVLERRLQ